MAVSILKGSDTAAIYTTVHTTGAINRPGYYQLPRAARVFDAVQAAGGMTDAADDNVINLAERLRDDMKILVPEKQVLGETMLATVNKKEFLQLTDKLSCDAGVSIMAANGLLLVSSFRHGLSCKIPAYVVHPGQRYIEAKEWARIVYGIKSDNKSMVDIRIG